MSPVFALIRWNSFIIFVQLRHSLSIENLFIILPFVSSHLIVFRLFRLRVVVVLEPIPADKGRTAGYTLDETPAHRRAT